MASQRSGSPRAAGITGAYRIADSRHSSVLQHFQHRADVTFGSVNVAATGRVPASAIGCRVERNVVINQAHPGFRELRTTRPKPVLWDKRLFQR